MYFVLHVIHYYPQFEINRSFFILPFIPSAESVTGKVIPPTSFFFASHSIKNTNIPSHTPSTNRLYLPRVRWLIAEVVVHFASVQESFGKSGNEERHTHDGFC